MQYVYERANGKQIYEVKWSSWRYRYHIILARSHA